jgi:hypothetical protein
MGFFSDLTSVVIQTALLPVEVAKDVVTMGGIMTDQSKPYTARRIGKVFDKIEGAIDDLET